MLGLPEGTTACLFDLDGVLTKTAVVHARAWKQMFDGYLRERGDERPFDAHGDYDTYVDGKPRDAGVRDFLASRGLHVGDYPGSVRYLKAARDAGLRRAVVSSSHNCADVLKAAGIEDLLEERVDGIVAEPEGLRGKPHPDTIVVGLDRVGHRDALLEHGAGIVVDDLEELR